eukprot:gnl/TRDRNA2_/TRDRNA2_202493_c0_seq1.p1 gnl/TRDRNA2_/TRDRNA2_202493_c0~~gnl/TRDRNA2_/TRDRNA2_202493_c0_seq1.p1  ORF type:complete len:313 (+),score=54.87 gnl/TRDRNA2_/TRDRNA2_202493_c0_seq1:133-1071(+)
MRFLGFFGTVSEADDEKKEQEDPVAEEPQETQEVSLAEHRIVGTAPVDDECESVADSMPLGCTFLDFPPLSPNGESKEGKLSPPRTETAIDDTPPTQELNRHDVVMWEQLRSRPGALVGRLRHVAHQPTAKRMLNVALPETIARVQAQWRGQLARKTGVEHAAHVYVEELCSSIASEISPRQLNKALISWTNARAAKQGAQWLSYLWMGLSRSSPKDEPEHRDRGALLMQSWYRGARFRRLKKKQFRAASRIQALCRGTVARGHSRLLLARLYVDELISALSQLSSDLSLEAQPSKGTKLTFFTISVPSLAE